MRDTHGLPPVALAAALLLSFTLLADLPGAAADTRKQHLPNGLRVVVQDNTHTGTVVVSALVRVTALHEPRGTAGIRQLTHLLVSRGEGYDERLRAAAARIGGSMAPDYVELTVSAPAEALEECVWLTREILFRPQMAGEALETVRADLIRRLAARDATPAALTIERLYQALYPGLGTGDVNAGDATCVAALTIDDVDRFHARHYLPNVTTIGVSGGVEGREALEIVVRVMGGLLPGSMPPEAPLQPPEYPDGTVELDGGGRTAVVAVGGRAVALGATQYPAMAVGMTLLGSGMDSRLYRALRVERALAYTIAAELTPSGTAPSGLVLVTCAPERLQEVAEVTSDEIARVTEERAGAEELQRARRYLVGRYALRRQRNEDVAHYLAVFEMLGGPQGYRRDAQLAGEIAAVDAEAVMQAMRALFRPAVAVNLRGCVEAG
ncbi:MAG: insulinase family protein [candidate division WS1 bacterium]|jgi:zinc protease|nr:insulinase family protein [candidate division WS1 bacterium]